MSLSSLIVQREVATMRQVEEALARQVIYGGDLITNLLEVASIDEAVLTPLIAESMRLAPAPAGELPHADEGVRALVPPEMAIQRSIVPLEVHADRLVLAVAEPLSRELEEQLSFTLGMSIEQRATTAVRVRQAIARAYGVPLERRVDRLVARLSGLPTQVGSMPPPLGVSPAVTEPPRPRAEVAPRSVSGAPGFGMAAIPLVKKAIPTVGPARHPTETGFPVVRAEVFAAASVRPAAEPASDSPPPPGAARVGLLQRDVAPGIRAARRRRGPVTLEAAKQEADDATDRDTLLDLFFDFTRQFFDYAALFLVHGDIAEGREAFGAGAARERVLGIGVPLDLPSLMSSVREKRAPVVAKVPADGLDAELLADLNRARDVEVAFVPLVVRTRVVAILIGDCGEVGIDRPIMSQVTTFSALVGKAFERIIVRRKLDGFVAGSRGGSAGRIDMAGVSRKGPTPSIAPVSIPSKGSIRPGPTTAPPPPANIAVLRKISGPPIPREEPESPMALAAAAPSPEPPDTSDQVITLPPPRPLEDSTPEIEATSVEAEDTTTLFDELGWEPPPDSQVPPPPSSAVAVPPHPPATPQGGGGGSLPSIIVDMDRELSALVERVIAGELDEQAEGELLRQGERAMRVVMARFPGPVTIDRSRFATMARPPRASDCGPVLRLVARERKVALPFMLERLGDPDPEIRGWATHVLCELPYPEAIPYLMLRLHDADASVRVSAGLALASIARTFAKEVRDELLGMAHSVDARERVSALHAMAELRQPALVPDLVRALGDGDEAVVAAAHEALVQVTRQDFGADARPWLRWWEQHASRNRIEWLIESLTHEISEIRRGAGEELRAVTKEYFGYASDLPARDRERAKQRYKDWWITEGRARFSRT